jgi:hypothetical protein
MKQHPSPKIALPAAIILVSLLGVGAYAFANWVNNQPIETSAPVSLVSTPSPMASI